MIELRCVKTKLSELPPAVRERVGRDVVGIDEFEPLQRNAVYNIAALEMPAMGGWRAYVVVDGLPFPSPFPFELFELVSIGVPADWKLAPLVASDGSVGGILSFPEWSDDPAFFERLIDEDDAAWAAYQRRMAVP